MVTTKCIIIIGISPREFSNLGEILVYFLKVSMFNVHHRDVLTWLFLKENKQQLHPSLVFPISWSEDDWCWTGPLLNLRPHNVLSFRLMLIRHWPRVGDHRRRLQRERMVRCRDSTAVLFRHLTIQILLADTGVTSNSDPWCTRAHPAQVSQ